MRHSPTPRPVTKPAPAAQEPEELDAAAQITPEDIAAAQEFWGHWGIPLLNAMLDAKAED